MHVRTPSVYAYVLVIIDTQTTFPYLTPAEFYRFHFILLAQRQKIIRNPGQSGQTYGRFNIGQKEHFFKKGTYFEKRIAKISPPPNQSLF